MKTNPQEVRFSIDNTEYVINSIDNFDLSRCVINGRTAAGQPITITCDQLAKESFLVLLAVKPTLTD